MDVIVVGGGIVGASAAHHLTTQGASTMLVSSSHTGAATPAGTGVIHPWPFPWDTPADWAFKLAAAAHLPRLMAELDEDGHPPGYEVTGALSVDAEGADSGFELMDSLSRREGFQTMGRVERLDPGTPRELFPLLPERDRGVFIEGGARLDGALARHALIEAAQERGLHLRTGQAHLMWEGDRVSGVRVGEEAVRAPVTIVAAGAWSAALLAPTGVQLPLFPVRGQMAHFALPGQRTGSWPGVRFGEHDFHAVAFAPDRISTSGTRRPEAGFTYRATAGELSQLLTTALETMPGLQEATLAQARVGFRPATHDGHQLLGRIEAVPGVVVATGLDSQGLTFGPFQGRVAAQLALDRETGLDLEPFRPDRPTQPA
ncbi:FAD-binding oxidoreductase [Nocardiopsis sp. HNM0947]|uniref:FAD-binding oxidoreductase n=1 Tax=Nocardiopsis coralli TaxID=2772213 RepID=A0ABR9P6N9_9ACTN|nr:FAD-dependent oxidoreductase [Nocardiopsis coralli]MBE2999499.1 FAD-binding oxidoreductase [Nocardiopsis coralli]